jgi:cysteine-rich repeat protein
MSVLARALAVLVATSPLLAACGGSGGTQPPAPACGDRAINAGEACDDGNTASGDGCSATCLVEAGFSCTGQPSACTTTCGDGAVGGTEACDDGNAFPGDGCSPTCLVESGFTCAGQPSACVLSVQQIDTFAGAGAVFQAGFVVGEAAAVKLGPLPRAVSLTAVQLLFGGAATTQTVTLRIYQDVGLAAPGAVLFEGDYQVTGADTAMQVADLSPPVAVPAGDAFRLSVFWQHAGLPGIARDDGTTAADANWVFISGGLGWTPWSTVGGSGNFILRAVVE